MPCISIIPSYTRTFDDFEVHSFFHPPKGNIGNITNERIDCKLALFFFLHMRISHVHALLLSLLMMMEESGPMICIQIHIKENCTAFTAHYTLNSAVS